jgi:imidazolonepropionase-like amidohydrolase
MTRAWWLAAGAFVAAAVPSIADAQSLVIRGATIHTLAGPPIPGGTVTIDNGRIAGVGESTSEPAGVPVLDATGLHVYPGLFDAASALGLTEIDAVDVTNDALELGEFNPHLQAFRAVHPPSEHLPVARANGITHAMTAPAARPAGVGGQASVVSLNGWTVEEMLVSPSVGFVFAWPTIQQGGRGSSGQSYQEAKREYDEQVRRLAGWLEDARRYDKAVQARQAVTRDLKLEAFSQVTRRELPLLLAADEERYIRDAIDFAATHDIRVVIVGGEQAWKVRDELANRSVPVILGPTQALPSGPDEAYDERYAAPALLHEAGVKIAFATFSASDSRTLPFQAGNAVPYGLPHDEALRAITVSPAEIYGIADRLGTIAVGKLANLIVTDGDPLDYSTEVRHVIIAGQDVGLENRQLDLYEKYRSRPGR